MGVYMKGEFMRTMRIKRALTIEIWYGEEEERELMEKIFIDRIEQLSDRNDETNIYYTYLVNGVFKITHLRKNGHRELVRLALNILKNKR